MDRGLQLFDVSLQQSSTHFPVSKGVETRSISLDSLKEVTDCLLEINQEVVKVILEYKKDIWSKGEMLSLVEDYFENSLETMNFCTALKRCLRRAVNIQIIVQAAVNQFEEDVKADFEEKEYVRTLQELRAFMAAGDPFREEFIVLFQIVYNKQASMLQKLHVQKRKLDKKLKSVKGWQKVSNVIFVATIVSVLIYSVMAASITAPSLVTALTSALAVVVGSVDCGKWCGMLWSRYEMALKGQREFMSSMQVGGLITMTDLTMTDLNNIRVLVEKLVIKIEALQQNADIAIREEDDVKMVMIEINKMLETFMETVEILSQNAGKYGGDMSRARTMIFQRVIRHPIR